MVFVGALLRVYRAGDGETVLSRAAITSGPDFPDAASLAGAPTPCSTIGRGKKQCTPRGESKGTMSEAPIIFFSCETLLCPPHAVQSVMQKTTMHTWREVEGINSEAPIIFRVKTLLKSCCPFACPLLMCSDRGAGNGSVQVLVAHLRSSAGMLRVPSQHVFLPAAVGAMATMNLTKNPSAASLDVPQGEWIPTGYSGDQTGKTRKQCGEICV